MKTPEQLAESIERFRSVFWEKHSVGRPPVGVVNPEVFLPIKYLRAPPPRQLLRPEDVEPSLVQTDYEFAFARAAVSCDDFMPFSAPWRGIPWLEAACGCPVRYSAGSLAPESFVDSLESLDQAAIPARPEWLDRMRQETLRLVASSPDDCWISPSILRGASDVLAAMRGLSKFYCDLYDDPGIVERAAGRLHTMLLKALEDHFRAVPPKLGGFGHIFGYWAPRRTIVIQEDVLGACSPQVYCDLFAKHTAQTVQRLTALVIFHLHSTGCRYYPHILEIPGIAGLEVTLEANGPPLAALVPMLRRILEQSRLILHVDHGFEHLPGVINQLPREGLYLVLRDDCVRTDHEFRQCISRWWQPP